MFPLAGALPDGPASADRTACPPASAGEPQPSRRSQTVAVAAVLGAMALVVLDAAMTSLALPAIAADLGVAPALAVAVVTAYQTGLIVALLPCAALGERFGCRRVFVSGLVLFLAAATLCALSPSLPWLIAARLLQGLGGAAVMALGVPLMRLAVPPARLGAVIGWNALAVALAGSAGPSLAALVLSHGTWPLLYLSGLPLGTFVLATSPGLPRTPGSGQPLDLRGMALSAGMFAALIVGAGLLTERPLAAGVLLLLGAAGMAVLVRREAPKAAPLIPLDLLRGRSFRLSVTASVLCFAGQTAAMIMLPFHLQGELGQSAAMAGACLAAWPLSVAAAAAATGRLGEAVSTAWLCAAGGACLALGLAAVALWPQGEPGPLIGCIAVCGAGFGLFQTPNNRNMFLSAPLARSAASGGLQGTARLTGQTAGAVLSALLFSLGSSGSAPRVGLGIGAGLALAAGFTSLLRRKRQ